MTTSYFTAAALAAALVAPAAAVAQTPPDAAAISRSVARDVTRNVTREVERAVRTFSDRYDQERQGPQQAEKITKSFKVGKTGALDLNNFNGDVTVTGTNGDEITIEALKRVRARTPEDAKAALEALQVNITERAGRVEVRTDFVKRDIRGGVDYTITVPAPTAVAVRTMSGDVKVTGVKGDLRADTLSGDVTLAGTGPSVRAKTLSGDVMVTDVAGDGELSFSSISGDVTARNVKAKSIDISNTSGELKLIDVICGRATAATMSGDVEFTGPLAKGGRYEFRSHSGDVRLTPTSTTGFEVDASTFSGTFRSEFPVTLRSAGPTTISAPTPPPPPPPPVTGGQTGDRTTSPRPPRPPRPGMAGRSVQGTYGDGSAVLNLVSFSGDITIVKK